MKFLIVGLGNPGPEYVETRHNIGFKVVEALCEKHKGVFQIDRVAHTCQIGLKGKKLTLIKPSTFMNLSGKAVNYWLQKENITRENLLVVTDDLSLPLGTIRIKQRGSDGGHNGLKDIQNTLGTTEYTRLRFGIGSEFSKGKQVDFVLGPWTAEEKAALEARIQIASEAIESFCLMGVDLAMTHFNGK